MQNAEIEISIKTLCEALATRNYARFTGEFGPDAIFEIPFGLEGGIILRGLPEIEAHFARVSTSPLGKLVEIEKVSSIHHQHADQPHTVTVEYFLEGVALKTKRKFKIQSSIALIEFREGKIARYKDFPNTLGLVRVADILQQFAAGLAKDEAVGSPDGA